MGSSHQHGNGRNAAPAEENRDESWAPHEPRETGYRGGSGHGSEQHMGYRAGGNLPRPSDNWSQAQGWRGGHRGKGPAGYTRSDERIREAACEALTEDDQIDATDFEVVVQGGEVTLTGTADDRHAKRLAEDCVWRISGVRDVQNQLRLRPTQGNQSSAGDVKPTKHRA